MKVWVPEDEDFDGRDFGEIVANGRAMSATRLGRSVPQPNGGKRAKHVDEAMERYHVFHKKEPKQLIQINPSHKIPHRVDKIGELLSIAYRTDKWYADGHDVDYRHVVEQGGQSLYEPVGSHKWATQTRLPVRAPEVVTLLGKSLGLFVKREDDGETYEANPKKSFLFCSPSGDMLLLYSPDEGFLAVACGGKLSVEKHGIDG